MPSPAICGIIYLAVSAAMLIPAIVPWAAVPIITTAPTWSPTVSPTSNPTAGPSFSPTRYPTRSPSNAPSRVPSRTPSRHPSLAPSSSPTASPVRSPTSARPSFGPSHSPTVSKPTASPSKVPSKTPSKAPSRQPSTTSPSLGPTNRLSPSPSPVTSTPSKVPTTSQPSKAPTSSAPSKVPTRTPTNNPTTSNPSKTPTTSVPSRTPTKQPSSQAFAISKSTRRQLASNSSDVRYLWLLWLWPCISYLFMGIAYLLDDPNDVTRHRSIGAILLGKELDGSMRWYCVILMLPVLVPGWLFWFLRHSTWLRKQRPFNEILPGIFLGRFPTKIPCSQWTAEETFPAEATIIVDLCAEMPVPREVFKSRRYISIPTLDQCPPNVEAIREVGATLAAHDDKFLLHQGNSNFRRLNSNEDVEGEGVRVKGFIYIFCANGRGRSTSFLLALLVMRGDCETIEEALVIIRRARPQINPKAEQIRVAKEAVSIWRAEQKGKEEPTPNVTRDRRGNSNADIVEFKAIDLDGTESNNIIPLESSTSKQSPTRSRKRGAQELGDAPAQFNCVPLADPTAKYVTLGIARSDLSFIAQETLSRNHLRMGGDIFGKRDEYNGLATAYQVIGPGPHARITDRSFVQDSRYLQDCSANLTDLSVIHLGEWHSHPNSTTPSDGDRETVANILSQTDKQFHTLVLTNVPEGATTVSVSAFQFSKESPRSYQFCQIKVLEESAFDHDHNQRHAELLQLRESLHTTVVPRFLELAEDDPSQQAQPLPEPSLQSTESRNVIDLALG